MMCSVLLVAAIPSYSGFDPIEDTERRAAVTQGKGAKNVTVGSIR